MRLFLVGLLLFGGFGCSKMQKARQAKSFHFEKAWARKSLDSDYFGFRINHRMKPLLFGEYVIQGNAVDGIQAYDRTTGNLKWKRQVVGGVEAGAALSDSSLFFGGNDGYFYAVDAYTGQTKWSFPLRAEALGQPVVADGVVYFVAGNNMAYAVKAKSGEQLWFYNRIDAANLTIRGSSEPTVVGNLVLMGFSDGYLVAINKKSGSVVWEKRLATKFRFHDVDAKPIVRNNSIYISSYDGKLYCLDLENGKTKWSTDDGGFTSVTINKSELYASTSDYRLVALDADSGKASWEKRLEKTVATSPQYYRGLLIYGEWDGDFVAVDARTGRDVDRYNTGRGLTSTPSLDLDNNMAYVMGTNGDMYAFKLKWQRSSERWEWQK